MNQEEVYAIADEGRNSISSYCMNECAAKCCKMGSLLLQKESEVHAIVGQQKSKLLRKKVLQKTNQGNYTYDYKKSGKSCPKLTEDNLCSIYKSPNRPKICSDFPLFVFKGYVSLSRDFCPAAKAGMLDSYIEKIKELGFKEI